VEVGGGREAAGRVVVVQLGGLHQHLRVRVARLQSRAAWRRAGHADPALVEAGVGIGARPELRQGRARREGERANEQKNSARGDGAAPAVPTHAQWASGGRCGNHPSSWYNRTTNPETGPKSTGTHAAAPGCMISALLKSAVTFDNI